jgi:hypothetical protein
LVNGLAVEVKLLAPANVYEYGALPPLIARLAEPSARVLQEELIEFVVKVITAGFIRFTVDVTKQPFVSVTVAVYEPLQSEKV